MPAALTLIAQACEAVEAQGSTLDDSFLAEFYAGAGDTERAFAHCAKALQDEPQDWRTLALRSRLHLAADRAEDAIADAAASLGLVYLQPGVHLLLGQAQGRAGQYEAAAQALTVAVTQAPGLLQAQEALAELYARFLDMPERAAWHRAQAMRLRESRTLTTIDPETIPTLRLANRPVFPDRPGAAAVDGRAPVIVVSGLPRSGTSMLMQALAAGGIKLLTDGLRIADEDNPRGYHEYEPATRLAEDSAWIASARGRAVKIVLPLLPHVPRGEFYRVLLIQRDLREVLLSQTQMLQRLGRRPSTLRPRALAAQYTGQERSVLGFLSARPGIGVLPLDYATVLADPNATAARIAAFLGGAFDEAACAAAIAPAFRRQIV
jgi:tetratricopeptide (TPR) repeat protein